MVLTLKQGPADHIIRIGNKIDERKLSRRLLQHIGPLNRMLRAIVDRDWRNNVWVLDKNLAKSLVVVALGFEIRHRLVAKDIQPDDGGFSSEQFFQKIR